MTQKIDNVKVIAGRLIRVFNTEKPLLSNAKCIYTSVWVEDSCGGNERCLLCTAKELEAFRYRSSRNIEDLIYKDGTGSAIKFSDSSIQYGRIMVVWNQKRIHWKARYYYNAVLVESASGSNTECLLLTNSELERCEYRASKNIEDLPKKGFFTDLFD